MKYCIPRRARFYSLRALDVQELALNKLREHPTLPTDEKLGVVDHGELWPRAFCAFVGCCWMEMDGNESQLHAHLQAEHADELAPIAACMMRGNAEDAFLSIYNEAVATKCRSQAPLAGSSLDRRALNSFNNACAGNKVEALVCFVCACTYTYVEEVAQEGKSDIDWVQPFKPDIDAEELLFLGRPVDEAGNLLSLQTFLERYGKVSGTTTLQEHESFDDWCLTWPSNATAGKKILCCPEDPCMFRHADYNDYNKMKVSFSIYASRIIFSLCAAQYSRVAFSKPLAIYNTH